MMTKEASFRGHSTPHSLRDISKAPSGHQLQEAEAAGASKEGMGITILKQKEIAEAEAQQNQPKQVLHTASCHSPYIPEYVGNQPATSVASASHS
jgi:hypothetical protein